MSVCVIGSLNRDTVLRVANLPRPGETITAQELDIHLGGKGANQAIAIARMGGTPTFIGATGMDAASAWMRECLQANGVDTRHLATLDTAQSGEAFVLVDNDGENSIVVAGGANLTLTSEDIPEAAITGHNVYLAQLETPIDVVEAIFSHPDAANCTRILNAAPARPEARRLFPHVDILVLNQTELATYAGFDGGTEADIVGAARSLMGRPGQSVLITLGAEGVAIVTESTVTRIPGRKVTAIDTTGAGDCFSGALANQLDRGSELDAAVYVANAASALAVTRHGASSAIPYRSEVEAILDDSGLSPD